jgi:hypothetical protein
MSIFDFEARRAADRFYCNAADFTSLALRHPRPSLPGIRDRPPP